MRSIPLTPLPHGSARFSGAAYFVLTLLLAGLAGCGGGGGGTTAVTAATAATPATATAAALTRATVPGDRVTLGQLIFNDRNLRRKLEQVGAGEAGIASVYGAGYRLDLPG